MQTGKTISSNIPQFNSINIYKICFSSNLNGDFENKSEFGVWWCKRKGENLFLESVQMLIRPKETK